MKSKFNPLRIRFRATFAGTAVGARRLGEIDAENEVLHDVQITLEGEAKGHGVWLDREFCEAVAEQGNATGDVGLKVRYGHPAMCSDAIGTELGRAKNFRVVDVERTTDDGAAVKCAGVIADVHLLASAHSAPQGDIAKHVLETAKEDPGQFGQSIVFTYADWVVKDADGNRHSYNDEVEGENAELDEDAWMKQSADGKVYAVLGKLHGSDFTDTPAATDGIFSTGTLAEEAEQMLAEHPEVLATIEKNPKALVEFLARTGLDAKLESARVAGLQAAKDKEIAALHTEISELKAASESAASALAELRSANESISADLGAKSTALEAAKAEFEQLRAKHAEAEKALAETQAALKAETERYREQVGLALQQPKEETEKKHGLALVRSTYSA